VQDGEADYFRRLSGRQALMVGQITTPIPLPEPPPEPPTLLFVGADNSVNRDAIRFAISEIWPLIRAELPGARFLVVGPICKTLSGNGEGVELCGQIPEISAAYAKAHVIFNPARSGTGNKIKSIEALAYGRPLVTTAIGAAGIEAGRDRAYLVAEGAKALAESCVILLKNNDMRRVMGGEGIRLLNDCNQHNYQALRLALGIQRQG
jgi:glycosyltransferase involved in cell wall biosynthesis